MGTTIEIEVRLFGLGRKAAGIETIKKKVIEGETLLGLWQDLKAEAKSNSVINRMSIERMLIVYNGNPCRGEEQLKNTLLSHGDKVTFMLMVCGG